jgi:hypothetical protein
MAAAADLRLAARPDLIELNKFFDISESSLIHHSVLIGQELGGLGHGTWAHECSRGNCELQKKLIMY